LFKKEIRILGLSASSEKEHTTIIVGVVFRGSLWLDGVITCRLDSNREDYLQLLTKQIIHSKQYSQLRVIILSKAISTRLRIDTAALAKSTKLPIISIVQKKRTRHAFRRAKEHDAEERDLYEFKGHGNPVFVRLSGIDVDRARQVYEVGRMETYGVPEAVRVADLIAKQSHIATSERQIK
jgi:endonuclease V-like protein UPF0215 family